MPPIGQWFKNLFTPHGQLISQIQGLERGLKEASLQYANSSQKLEQAVQKLDKYKRQLDELRSGITEASSRNRELLRQIQESEMEQAQRTIFISNNDGNPGVAIHNSLFMLELNNGAPYGNICEIPIPLCGGMLVVNSESSCVLFPDFRIPIYFGARFYLGDKISENDLVVGEIIVHRGPTVSDSLDVGMNISFDYSDLSKSENFKPVDDPTKLLEKVSNNRSPAASGSTLLEYVGQNNRGRNFIILEPNRNIPFGITPIYDSEAVAAVYVKRGYDSKRAVGLLYPDRPLALGSLFPKLASFGCDSLDYNVVGEVGVGGVGVEFNGRSLPNGCKAKYRTYSPTIISDPSNWRSLKFEGQFEFGENGRVEVRRGHRGCGDELYGGDLVSNLVVIDASING